MVVVALCVGCPSRAPLHGLVSLTGSEDERNANEGGEGLGGDGPGSTPFVSVVVAAPLARGGQALPVTLVLRDEDGIDGAEVRVMRTVDDAIGDAAELPTEGGDVTVVLPELDVAPAFLRVVATDRRGYRTIVDSNDFIIDATPPTLRRAMLPLRALGGGELRVAYEASDNIALGNGQFALATSAGVLASAEAAPLVAMGELVFSLPATDVAAVTLRGRFSDAAGNSVTLGGDDDLTVDATPPSAPLVTWTTPSPSAADTVDFQVTGCEALVQVAASIGTTPPASGFAPCAGVHSLPLPAIDGTYTLHVWALDDLGQLSVASSPHDHVRDATPPVLALTVPAAVQTASSVDALYVATDDHFGASPIAFALSLDGGTTYASLGAATPNTGAFTFSSGATASTTASLRLTATDVAGNSATLTAPLVIDGGAPLLTVIAEDTRPSAADYAPPPTFTSPVARVSLMAQDADSAIAAVCLKSSPGAAPPAPAANDACWIDVANPVLAVAGTAQPNGVNVELDYRYGFAKGFTYRIYGWVRDASGRSSLNTASSLLVDYVPLRYDPGTPPAVTNVFAMNSDAPSWPLQPTALTAATGDTVTIKWHATFPNNAAPAVGKISLYYTEDDLSYTPIAVDLPNAATGGCSLTLPDANGAGDTSDSYTGCFVWQQSSAASPQAWANKPGTYYTVRVVATDDKGISTARGTVPPLNALTGGTTGLQFLAGNTDPGIGGNALSTVFNTSAGETSCMSGLFAMSSRGVLYFVDRDNGLVRVDPNTAGSELLVRNAAASAGDGGDARLATTNTPTRVYLDSSDRIYLVEYRRLRRIEVDAAGNPTTISTILGGGAINSGSMLVSGMDPASLLWNCVDCAVTILPNDDVVTSLNPSQTPSTIFRVLRLQQSPAPFLEVITPTGSGLVVGAAPGTGVTNPISECHVDLLGVEFDPLTSATVGVYLRGGAYAGETTSCSGIGYGIIELDAAGATKPPAFSFPPAYNATSYCMLQNGADGRMYWWSSNGQAGLHRYSRGAGWAKLAGQSSGSFDYSNCADGTDAIACRLNLKSFYVDALGAPYTSAEGMLRTIDDAGKMVTLYGESEFYGDSTGANPDTPSLSARIARLEQAFLWRDGTNDRLVMGDLGNLRIREAVVGGLISTLAGNGAPGSTGANPSVAYGQPTNFTVSFPLAVDARNGDVFTTYDGSKGGVTRLDRSTGNWSRVIGCGAPNCGTAPVWSAPDGSPGASLRFLETPAVMGISKPYYPSNVGIFSAAGRNMLGYVVGYIDNNQGPGASIFRDYSLKLFDMDNNYAVTTIVQTQLGAAVLPPLPTGANRSTTNLGYYQSYYTSRPQTIFDTVNKRLLWARGRSLNIRTIAALPLDLGLAGPGFGDAPITDFVGGTGLPQYYTSFAYRQVAGTDYVYYCMTPYPGQPPAATDFKIHVRNLSNGMAMQLPWPISSVQCRGITLTWDPTRNALVFPYQRNGLWGVAEYVNPPVN